MSDFERDYRDLMGGVSLSESAREHILAAARENSEIGAQDAASAFAPRPSEPRLSNALSRRRFLTYGAAAVVAAAAIGVGLAGDPLRIATRLAGVDPLPHGASGERLWFSMAAWASEPGSEPPAGSAVELRSFFPVGVSMHSATKRLELLYQFDFALAGEGIASATYSFESADGASGAIAEDAAEVMRDRIGFIVNRFHTDYEYSHNEKGWLTVSENVTHEGTFHLDEVTVEGEEDANTFRSVRNVGETRQLYVLTDLSTHVEWAYQTYFDMPSEEPLVFYESKEGEEALLAQLERNEQLRDARISALAEAEAIAAYETGLVLEKRPLRVTVTFENGSRETKRYRITPLPLDEIKRRWSVESDGYVSLDMDVARARAPMENPLFTITELA